MQNDEYYEYNIIDSLEVLIMEKINGGVTAAKGFYASSAEANIKYKDRTDMALVFSKRPCSYAGTFTQNVFKAAPVLWDMNILKTKEMVHAIVLNSGIANACTGTEGEQINEHMASEIAKNLGIQTKQVLTASTGVIGMQLDRDKLTKGAKLLKENLGDSLEKGLDAAKAIMTTDTVKKEAAFCFEIDGKKVTIGGMSKGSGMIHPNMATMLSVTTTDAKIDASLLQEMVSEAVSDSFNMISVDRDTSTNDTYVVLANGESEVTIEKDSKGYELFKEALNSVCKSLAKQMAKDGEGASKLFEISVINCESKKKAKTLARSVTTSNLVKTAIYGNDANYGRILCALGYAGEDFDPSIADLYFNDNGEKFFVYQNGAPCLFDEAKALEILKKDEIYLVFDMHEGDYSACGWGCDLTHEYISINADYRS